MQLTEAANLDRKSGEAEGPAVRPSLSTNFSEEKLNRNRLTRIDIDMGQPTVPIRPQPMRDPQKLL